MSVGIISHLNYQLIINFSYPYSKSTQDQSRLVTTALH
jgi:hypothetical protein